jgi:hypothetical protein
LDALSPTEMPGITFLENPPCGFTKPGKRRKKPKKRKNAKFIFAPFLK